MCSICHRIAEKKWVCHLKIELASKQSFRLYIWKTFSFHFVSRVRKTELALIFVKAWELEHVDIKQTWEGIEEKIEKTWRNRRKIEFSRMFSQLAKASLPVHSHSFHPSLVLSVCVCVLNINCAWTLGSTEIFLRSKDFEIEREIFTLIFLYFTAKSFNFSWEISLSF